MPVPLFNGLGLNLGNLAELSNAQTRSISAENFTGAKGQAGKATSGAGADAARELGQGWKISPCISIPGKSTVTLADVAGPGAIQHIWITCHPDFWRRLVLRAYWDGEDTPSIETPLGDFFANGWCTRCNITSLPVAVNPAGGFNSYWEMPFRQHARITIENLSPDELRGFYYQVTYTLTEVPETRAYLHAQWRRSNPLKYMDVHTLLDGVRGQGHYVGTYLAWGVNNNGWWGEGEIKFFMDGDTKFPTICGTGTEDYFCGSYGFENPKTHEYQEFSTPYTGMPQVIKSEHPRFSLYRWHIMDPVRFEKDLRVTMQALGWQSEGRYLPLRDDISSVAYWYQTEPHAAFPSLPDRNGLVIK
jgi:hypothetical protein